MASTTQGIQGGALRHLGICGDGRGSPGAVEKHLAATCYLHGQCKMVYTAPGIAEWP